MIVVGAWTEEEYLEDIEPAIAGRFRYIYVPPWKGRGAPPGDAPSAGRRAVGSAGRHHCARGRVPLTWAAGDISLFRSLVETLIEKSEAAPAPTADSAAELNNVQEFNPGALPP